MKVTVGTRIAGPKGENPGTVVAVSRTSVTLRDAYREKVIVRSEFEWYVAHGQIVVQG